MIIACMFLHSSASVNGSDWTYFSAACWLFGRDLYDHLQIPIGLVDTDYPMPSAIAINLMNNCTGFKIIIIIIVMVGVCVYSYLTIIA